MNETETASGITQYSNYAWLRGELEFLTRKPDLLAPWEEEKPVNG